ncbi:interferon alpha-1/2-like [Lutra lutra]|uniref:interferon alpha-1/2-like n=1 Tax=Lutra lutra TaxID=9657 RepID=UPI001FCFBBDA|nr:interferon alpha-1/2-like [Lutra lutra]
MHGRQFQDDQATYVPHEMLQLAFTLFLTRCRHLQPEPDPAGQTLPRAPVAARAPDTCVVPVILTHKRRCSEKIEPRFPDVPTPGRPRASAGSPVALPSSFFVTQVVLSCHSLGSLGCDLPQDHGLLHWRAFMLLQQMRRLSASSCDNYTNNFGFPQEAFNGKLLRKAQALSAVHVTNQKTFQLFCTEASPVSWNTTLLEELCSGLSEQVGLLEARPLQEAGVGEMPLVNGDSILRNYFQRISLYLREKEYSPCAWKMVRAEIMKPLYASTALQERLRRKK